MNYDIMEAARYLGLTVADVRSATKHRRIACIRPSPRKTLYDPVDLDAWRATWTRVEAVQTDAE